MMKQRKKNSRVVLLVAGSVILLAGITLILVWSGDVVILFKGALGIATALAGMILLYMAGQNR